MSRPFHPRIAVALALAAAPAQLSAATPPSNVSAAVQLLRPLTVQKVQDLDFGWVSAPAAGTIVVDPASGAATTTGGLIRIGGTPQPAKFTGAAGGSSVVNIKLPNQPVTLTRVGGTETISLSKFTLDGASKRAMAQASSFDFKVGGTLTIGANQADGDYQGTFTVTVQYP